MRVFLTGADGYIGAIMGPKLIEAGHDVVGLDTGFYRRGWLFDDGRTHPAVFSKDQRRDHDRGSARLRRGGASRGALERPDRRERPGPHHGDQPRGLGQPRAHGARGRGEALHPGLELLVLRRRRRRDAHRDQRARAADRLRALQDPRRGGPQGPDGRRLHPGLHAQRHRLRREPAAALRPRAQQPLRLRPHHARDPHDLGRHALAADHPYRGHLRGDALRADGRPRRRSPARPSTSAPTARTTASARSPRSSPGPSPAAS